MTHQELVDFFNFAGLEFSENPESIRLLKKQLLLELKASSTDSLMIAGKEYGKNSLLALFDSSDVVATTLNVSQIQEEYPVLRDFMKTDTFVAPMVIPKSIWDHPDINRYCEAEVYPRFGDYLRMVQSELKNHLLRQLASALQFLQFFSEEQQYQLQHELKLLLRNTFLKVREAATRSKYRSPIEEDSYFANPHFYEVILKIGSDDQDFLMEQLDTAEKSMRRKWDAIAAQRIYGHQLKLPLPQEVKNQISINLNQLNPSSTQSSDSQPAGRIVWVIVAVIGIVLRVVMMSNRSEPSYTTPYIPPQGFPYGTEQSVPVEAMPENGVYETEPSISPAQTNQPQTAPPPVEEPVQQVISAPDSL